VWEPRDEQFERNLSLLKEFVAREGHARVPALYTVGSVRLGSWVNTLRTSASKIPAEKVAILNAAGFIWSARKKS